MMLSLFIPSPQFLLFEIILFLWTLSLRRLLSNSRWNNVYASLTTLDSSELYCSKAGLILRPWPWPLPCHLFPRYLLRLSRSHPGTSNGKWSKGWNWGRVQPHYESSGEFHITRPLLPQSTLTLQLHLVRSRSFLAVLNNKFGYYGNYFHLLEN